MSATSLDILPAEGLIDAGRYEEAYAILTELISRFPGAVRPRQLAGLALRRWGHLQDAQQILGALYDEGHRDPETMGIYASTCMDAYNRRGDIADLRRSRDLYAEAFRLSPTDYYTGLNAASKSVFLGEMDPAKKYAADVHVVVDRELKKGGGDYWLLATDAELQLIEQNYDEAAKRYYKAIIKSPPEKVGSQFSTWLQAKRLMRALRTPERQQDKIWRAFQHLTDAAPGPRILEPPCRRLRVFAFDPSMARHLETAPVNQVTLELPWEAQADGTSALAPGPVGEYLEVVDYDPASGCFYEPLDLDEPRLLGMDGFAPSEGDPRFHQQMVYAVGMNLIDHFERALGRKVLWASHPLAAERTPAPADNNQAAGDTKESLKDGPEGSEQFVRRLRIYPHALREANAYYSPAKKALLFGYFQTETRDPDAYGPVFTCLSHDVIAHEMSHAVLDGLRPRFAEPSNPDVLAFHEAFADIVALFQHFSHSEILLHEIARTRSDLGTENLLGKLAVQFGRAIGSGDALRDAIGKIDKRTGQWRPKQPSTHDLEQAHEAHDRGSVLVGAIFEAFLAIYKSRIADLLRIATQGSGILAPGALHPDLVRRLAAEAAKTSTHFLRLCIRALDYCPPVDIRLGDYLRAMITADVDFVPDDRYNYRLALLEAFQRRGIYPDDVRTLSVESLVWRPPRRNAHDLKPLFRRPDKRVGNSSGATTGTQISEERTWLEPEWRPTADRQRLWESMRGNAGAVKKWLEKYCDPAVGDELGLALGADSPRSLYWRNGAPEVEVHSVRVARRNTPQGSTVTDLVVEIIQRRRGYLDPDRQKQVDDGNVNPLANDDGDFTFYGGCTLLIDPFESLIRFSVSKHILSESRLKRERDFRKGVDTSADSSAEKELRATYFGNAKPHEEQREPFAMLHRTLEENRSSRGR